MDSQKITDHEKICENLSNFPGGSIDLKKNNENGIAFIIINNPEKKNSFTGSMMVELRNVLSLLENWSEGKAVILYGSNNFFCSGGDLNMVKQILDDKNCCGMSEIMQDNLNRLQNLDMITLCLVQGKAIGGGAELLTACDFRLATKSARIGFVHRKLGITTGWSGGVRLVNLIGKNKALDLMLDGRQVTAEEALNYGLINEVLENDDNFDSLINSAINWLSKYIDGSKTTIKAIKTIVNAATNLTTEEALDIELKMFKTVWGAEAHKNALKANLKHR